MCIITITTTFYIKTMINWFFSTYYDNNSNNNNKDIIIDINNINKTNIDIISKSWTSTFKMPKSSKWSPDEREGNGAWSCEEKNFQRTAALVLQYNTKQNMTMTKRIKWPARVNARPKSNIWWSHRATRSWSREHPRKSWAACSVLSKLMCLRACTNLAAYSYNMCCPDMLW